MDAIEFFMLQYERLHRQVTRDVLQGLSKAQMRFRPNGLNSIAWLVCYMARCEDALSVLLAGRPQVLDEERWLPRLRALKAEYPFWGYRRIWAHLRFVEQLPVNKKRIWRLMHEHRSWSHPTCG